MRTFELSVEPFSSRSRTASRQAASLRSLVIADRINLSETDQTLLSLFGGGLFSCMANLVDYARSTKGHFMLLQDEKSVVGLASAFPNRSIRHPDLGDLRGLQVDYWLPSGGGGTIHEAAARCLVEEFQGFDVNLLATVARAHLNPQIGFASVMRSVGEPAVLQYFTGNAFVSLPGENEAQLYMKPA